MIAEYLTTSQSLFIITFGETLFKSCFLVHHYDENDKNGQLTVGWERKIDFLEVWLSKIFEISSLSTRRKVFCEFTHQEMIELRHD